MSNDLLETAPQTLILVARNPLSDGRLRYREAPLWEYLRGHCSPSTNDCPDNVFDNDCTHFVCHALNKAGVFVRVPSANCASGLCIRVNDLAESFHNSTTRYSNVHKLSGYAATRAGDFCFRPGWFHIDKDHVMVLAATATGTSARVYGHTNPRCGDEVPLPAADCTYYRIDET